MLFPHRECKRTFSIIFKTFAEHFVGRKCVRKTHFEKKYSYTYLLAIFWADSKNFTLQLSNSTYIYILLGSIYAVYSHYFFISKNVTSIVHVEF